MHQPASQVGRSLPANPVIRPRFNVKIAEVNLDRHTGFFLALSGGAIEDDAGQAIKDDVGRTMRLAEIRKELRRVYGLTRSDICMLASEYRRTDGPKEVRKSLRNLAWPNGTVEPRSS